MNLKVDDFVEGYEYYGNIIRKTKGWINNIYEDSIHIQADDNYHGYRETTLFFKLGDIVLINNNLPRRIIKI